MANIGEKAISILAGNSNSGLSYLITTVLVGICVKYFWACLLKARWMAKILHLSLVTSPLMGKIPNLLLILAVTVQLPN